MAEDIEGIKRKLAEGLTITALARLMQLVGIPVAILMAAWAGSRLVTLSEVTVKTHTLVEGQQRQIDGHEIRINRLEQKYFSPGAGN